MSLFTRFVALLTQFLDLISLPVFGDNGLRQVPLHNDAANWNAFNPPDLVSSTPLSLPDDTHEIIIDDPPAAIDESTLPGPIFSPPGSQTGSNFQCDYTAMTGWENCSTPTNRSCWLSNGNEYFDIHTNYESRAPIGIQRNYTLVVANGSYNADGLNFPDAKLFNESYPGPWVQACWGDTVQITVINNMPYNGTSIHWHGIRQYQTMHMDGVNGVTQCPIAPGESFVYKWNVTQYGSSWYHSHYSIQYADGVVGPLTLHGPTSDNYDEAGDLPLLVTDWGHNSAFEALYKPPGVKNIDILLNGIGNITRFNNTIQAELEIPDPYTLVLKNGNDGNSRKYLLRLINTSFQTTFVFSIDNHYLTMVSADFVPITPYRNTSVLIGIGQRYEVIVETAPSTNGINGIPDDGNFWIRTYVANCTNSTEFPHNYERNGILRYNEESQSLPTSEPWTDISFACSDETYSSLSPVLKWNIGNPANAGQEQDVVFNNSSNQNATYPLAAFSLQPTTFNSSFIPLRINYDDPTFLHLNNTKPWDPQWVVVPENYSDTDWVYLVIAGDRKDRGKTIGAHPIHLHGHDFAILQQAENQVLEYGYLHLKFDNPPRRDVVLLPRNGFIVIAFKTDNPGSWLMHCHIARHAAEGLALQILERQNAANGIWPWNDSSAITTAREGCETWKKWRADCNNWWPGNGGGCAREKLSPEFAFQDDSGI